MTVASSQAIGPAAAHTWDRTRQKIALRLLPFLFLLYIINYVDRTNLAYAALGMSADLGFSDRVFGLGSGIFFVSYLALQVPGALLAERWSARRMISMTLIVWGSLTVLTALVCTPSQLYLARFTLGAAEAGFFPGVIVYLSHWFIPRDRAKATSNFMSAIPLSAVLGSPLAGWILGQGWFAVKGWRWLFVVEGLPAVVLGVLAFFLLTDWPRQATWLTTEQRQWIEQKLQEGKAPCAQTINFLRLLRCRPIPLLALIPLFSYFVFYCFIFWLPTVLKRQSGLSDLQVGLVGALPFLANFVAMLLNGWHSDRNRERRWHSAVPLFLAAAALLPLAAKPHSILLQIILFTVVGIGNAYLPTFWAIPTEILSGSIAATAVGIINSVGSIAGFVGPFTFGLLYTMTGSFSLGLGLMMIAALAGGFLILGIPDVVSDPLDRT